MVDATVVGFGDTFGSGVWFQTCLLLAAPGYRVPWISARPVLLRSIN